MDERPHSMPEATGNAPASADEPLGRAGTSHPPAPAGCRLLIVDDDPHFRRVLRRLLEVSGYQIIGMAENGRIAVEMVNALRPDVVLMDLEMPEMNGIEATRAIQQTAPTPVVILSGHDALDECERASDAGICAYLTKPAGESEIARALAVAQARFRDMMELRTANEKLQQEVALRIQVEQNLRQSQAELKAVFENAPLPMILVDGMTIRMANHAARQLLRPEAPEGRRCGDPIRCVEHFSASAGCGTGEACQRCVIRCTVLHTWNTGEDRQHVEATMTRKRPDGSSFRTTFLISTTALLSEAGRHVLVTLNDVTETKRAEDTNRLNQFRLQMLAELGQKNARNLHELCDFALEKSLQLTRSPIGYLYFYDEESQRLTNYAWSRQAMDVCRVVEPQRIYELEKTGLWGEAVRQRKPIVTNDYAAPNPWVKGVPPGHVPLTRHMNLPVFSGSRIVAVAGVGNKPEPYDESDMMQLQLLMQGAWLLVERVQAEDAMRAHEKLAATGRLAAQIAHEINNPLAGIKNCFQLLKRAIPPEHPDFGYAARLEKEIDRIGRIVRQMYHLYRPEQESATEFDVRDAVREVIGLAGMAKRAGLRMEVQDCGPLPMCLPEDSLRQVLFNLVQNAIDASPEDGSVRICIERSDAVRISVHDEGGGIAPEVAARMFEPFFSTKDSTKAGGLGLGLSVSRSLTVAMGGTLTFRTDRLGTVFQIELPLALCGS